MDPFVTPSVPELHEQFIKVALERVHTAMAGKIQSYDAARQVADIVPQVPRVVRGRLTRERKLEHLPVLADVPIMFPQGGEYFFHFPVTPGDTCLLLVTESDFNEWLRTGQPIDPGLSSRFRISSAVAFLGLTPDANRITGAAPGALTIGKRGGPMMVIDSGSIRLGSALAADFVALSSKVDAAIAAITAFVNSHTHAISVPVAVGVPPPVLPVIGTAAGVSSTPVPTLTPPASVAATKATAE